MAGAVTKPMMIHMVAEAVIMLAIVVYLNKKIAKQQADLQQLEKRVAQSEETTKRCLSMCQQLYAMINQEPKQRPPPVRAPQPQSPFAALNAQMQHQHPGDMLDALAAAQMFSQLQAAEQAQAQQQVQPQAPPSPPSQSQQQQPSMMQSILTMLPTMIGPLMSTNQSGMIIAELEKIPPPAPQAAAAKVEIQEDDEDIEEALEEVSK